MNKRDDEKLSNYIPINRKLFEHSFWNENRPFSRFEAWLDLIKEARFEITEARMLIGNKVLKWGRGELPVSLRFLSERWSWSKNKVDSFLNLLENEGMITKRTAEGTGRTIITLCNYTTYNANAKNKGQLKGQDGDSTGTAQGQGGDKTNNINKENKDNKIDAPPKADAPPSHEDEVLFEGFKKWIGNHAPRVAQMKEPFTLEQYLNLRKKMSKDEVKQILSDMHNWEPLIKKNRSAYLTLLKWNRMRLEKDGQTVKSNFSNNGFNTDEYKQQREREEQEAKASY